MKTVGAETFDAAGFIQRAVAEIAEQIGHGRAVCGLSGGIDSAVSAVLVHRAIGDRLTCIFVDHGMMRQGEPAEVERVFREQHNINLVMVDAVDRFLGRLKGVADPERKRKIIGEEFIRVFEEEAAKLGPIEFLVQGTIYPDILESAQGHQGVKVKSHHNVGGLPEHVGFSLVEPVKGLYKWQVRLVGEALGLPKSLTRRQPFPGPGLGVRCIGEITREKLDTLRAADAIVRQEMDPIADELGLFQYFAVLPDLKSVGVADGERTYSHLVAVRAVLSPDAVSAKWARIPFDVLERISARITAEVPGVNRVVYDITSKPPAPIEWE